MAALAILSVETAWWLPQPCTGDVACAPVIGLFTALGLIPLAIGFLVWRATGHASAVIVIDTLIIAAIAPLVPSLLLSGGLTNVIALILAAVPFLLAYGGIGAAADLTPHRAERIGAALVLAAIATWFVLVGLTILALTLIPIAGMVGTGLFRRPYLEPPEADAADEPDPD